MIGMLSAPLPPSGQATGAPTLGLIVVIIAVIALIAIVVFDWLADINRAHLCLSAGGVECCQDSLWDGTSLRD